MMPYDINGQPIDDNEDDGIIKVFIAVVVAILFTALLCNAAANVADTEEPEPVMSHVLAIDYNNAALMHEYGMPTAEDVMYYHLHGQWGYYENGVQMTFDTLPGKAERWDTLYGIPDNPKFDK